MVKSFATKMQESTQGQREAQLQPLYLKTVRLEERLHRRLLDVHKTTFDRQTASINPVQAYLLYNVGEQEITVGELRTRVLFRLERFL
jgi:hypothetical protein